MCSEGVPGNSTNIKAVPQTDTGGKVEYTKALRELWLRNSAKCSRNFGIRETHDQATGCGWHRIGGSDCLLKTQHFAKS
tara:strand:- start:13 stop:249 length:237 start_codon:yes stop_codon:yes gene_type:complete